MTELLIPRGHTLLHVGPQKTGSTGIQQAMHTQRDELARQGVFYPGPHFRPAEAGWAVMGIGSAVGRPAPKIEGWHRLVADVKATELDRTCVSNEDFARADDAAIERIVSDLGGDKVHLVYVARRIDKLLPSHWQERVKARMTMGWPEFVDTMMADSGPWEWRMMWEAQRVGEVVDKWAKHVDRSQISVIVADESNRDLMARTFEGFLGLTEGTLVPPTTKSNRSLSYAEAETVRRINQLWADNGWDARSYWRIVQGGVAVKLKNSDRTDDTATLPPPSPEAQARIAELSAQQAQAVRDAGVRVIGDPDDLLVSASSDGAADGATRSGHDVDRISMELFANVFEGAIAGSEAMRDRQKSKARRNGAQEAVEGLGGRELLGLLKGRVTARLRPTRRG